jgi:hypothetical protein
VGVIDITTSFRTTNDDRIQTRGGNRPASTDRDKIPVSTPEGVGHCDFDTGTLVRISSNLLFHFHSQANGTPVESPKLVTLGNKEMEIVIFFVMVLGPKMTGSAKHVFSTVMTVSTINSDWFERTEKHFSFASPDDSEGDIKNIALAFISDWLTLTKSMRQSI